MQQGVDPLTSIAALVHLVEGIPFAAPLLFILTVHEFGHYFAARRWGVRASLPYFLPLPYVSFLGTLGAVIKIRSPIPNKRALLDIGAAGPLAGFVVALAACFAGLSRSAVVSADYFHSSPIELGAPLLFSGIAALVLPAIGPNQMVLLDPVAFAGWVGLFITAFNLFPDRSTRRRAYRVRALWPPAPADRPHGLRRFVGLGALWGLIAAVGMAPRMARVARAGLFSRAFWQGPSSPSRSLLSRWTAADTSSAISACWSLSSVSLPCLLSPTEPCHALVSTISARGAVGWLRHRVTANKWIVAARPTRAFSFFPIATA